MAESGEEWELSKENIRPIQQGRRQKVLKVALAPHPEELISQQRQSFENELRTYSGDDPLFVWCKYIKWVEQNYPKGGREGHIKQLMERCLSIFKDEQKYFDDDRFIDIMLKYAGLSGKPLEVYNYMYSNNIGCKSAKFFINWSWELEQIGSIKKADDVLTEGMQRKAQPFEKMKSYHTDFEIRLATKIKESVETNIYDSENSRSAFSVLKPQKKNLAPILRTGEAVMEKKSSLTLNKQQPQPKNVKTSSKIPFKIFNSENANPLLPVQIQPGARSSLNHENFKENEQKPSKWNKVKMKSRNLFHETNPDFKFHCDDEKGDQLCTPRSVPKTSNILSSRRRTPSPPIALFEPPDPKKKPMYPKNKVYGGAEEYSLEEIRAVEWLERKKKAEKDRLLAEQQKKIEEQAKKEEHLKKQVEFLSKKIEMLQNCSGPSKSKPCILSGSQELGLMNNKVKSTMNVEIKDLSQKFQDDSYAETYKDNSSKEKNIDSSVYCSADRMLQELYNKSLSQPAEDTTSKISDLSKEFDIKCSLLSTDKNTINNLPQTDQIHNAVKQSGDIAPFTFYHDPTTKVILDSGNISLKGNMNSSVSKQSCELQCVSKCSDKQSFTFFNDCTDTSHKVANPNQIEEIQNVSEKTDYKLPFTFYNDPTEKTFETDKTDSSAKALNKQDESNLSEMLKTDKATKESKDLPFAFYHDPTTAISNTADTISENKSFREHLYQELPDEDGENIPPKGYIQNNTKRELAGILEPSKNILFIPLDEQHLDEEDDDESDFEDYIYQQGRACSDETLIPPSNTEQFSTAKFLASTPCVNKFNKGTSSEKSIQSSLKQTPQNLSNPSENLSEKKHFLDDENAEIKPELQPHKQLLPKSDLKNMCHSRLPNTLSVIMETSENYSKSSSSSSSASLTKSNHLDQNSVYHLNLHKQHSKLESGEKSINSKISENTIQSAKPCMTIDIKDKITQGRCIESSVTYSADDPFDPKIIKSLLKSIKLDHYKNIFNSSKSIRSVKLLQNIQIGDETYVIENEINQGAYGKVYKASKLFKTCDNRSKPLALKVCEKADEWEFYICSEIHRRLSERKLLPDIKDSVMSVITAIKYNDGILLANEYSPLGTLLDVINFYKKQNLPVPELICMFFTLQVLQIVSVLHKCNIIHGDIKPDNFLLTSTYPDEDILDNMTGSTACLRLIDFGRAIDLSLYDKGICFTSSLSINDFQCNEMKDQKPWVFQLDWYGVISCIHTLLFQEYMKVTKKDGIWKIEKKFKRYWFNSLWEPLFSKLLNIPACYEEPDVAFFINLIVSKLQQNASNFIGQLSRFSDAYSKRKYN